MEAQPTADAARRNRGVIVGIKTAHYERAGVGAGRTCGRGGQRRRHPGDGGLRQEPAGAAARRAGHREAAARRHLHARVLGPARTSSIVPVTQPRALRGPEARRASSTWGTAAAASLWRVAVPAVQEGFLPDTISTDLHIGSMNAGHEGHAQRDEQVPGARRAARGSDPAIDVEPRAGGEAGVARAPVGRRAPPTSPCCASSKAASGSSISSARGCTAPAAGVRADRPRRQGRVRPERLSTRPEWGTLPADYGAHRRQPMGCSSRQQEVSMASNPCGWRGFKEARLE